MIDAVLSEASVDKEKLLSEIREIHIKHRTSEYAFVLEDISGLKSVGETKRLAAIRAGIDAYRKARVGTLQLYRGVRDTLLRIHSAGTKLVAFTESQQFYTIQRIKAFELDGILDTVYCVEDHDIPSYIDLKIERSRPSESYELAATRSVVLPKTILKPDPRPILQILSDFNIVNTEAAYVGDNLYKDIVMAQKAGVIDVYAAYGKSHTREGYDLLRQVSHWLPQDIEREKTFGDGLRPTITLEHDFAEIMKYIEFHG